MLCIPLPHCRKCVMMFRYQISLIARCYIFQPLQSIILLLLLELLNERKLSSTRHFLVVHVSMRAENNERDRVEEWLRNFNILYLPFDETLSALAMQV